MIQRIATGALFVLLLTLFSPLRAAAADVGGEVDYQRVVDEIALQGDAAVAAYLPDAGFDTADVFSELYFDLFEESGMELDVGMRDPAVKTELESLFSTLIGVASKGRSEAAVTKAWQALRARLQQVAAQQPRGGDSGFWTLLLQSFLILLREGFEAMLVITTLVTYLRRQEAEEKVYVIYYGVGLALLASLLTAWLLGAVFEVSGAAQEALEGITMLIAAGVLFYVSYWLISKSESARWQAWIQGQLNRALSKGSLFALGFTAFLAVYREGAETVLFYQALAGQAEGQGLALALGFAAAATSLIALYWIMRNASLRLPIGLFFAVTAGLLYYLSISFAGNGILELQEAGWVGITPLEWAPRVTWLGLHPTVETIAAQGLLLLPLPFALFWWSRQRRRTAAVEESAS